MKSSTALLITWFLATAVPIPTLAGGMDVGGEDHRSFAYGSAWFLGKSPVLYCIESAPDFGGDIQKARNDIEQAVRIWRDYIEKKRVFDKWHDSFKKVDAIPAMTYQFLDHCDGREELTFYLGVLNPKTIAAKNQFENPTAFVNRESYDPVSGRGKGFIWLTSADTVFPGAKFPDWTLKNRMLGIFLHEIGHTLGLGHFEGTIMEESLTHWMQGQGLRFDTVLSQIDDRRELYICRECPFEYKGILYANSAQAQKHFELLTGRKPKGKISARVTYKFGPGSGYQLEVSDAVKIDRLQISQDLEPIQFSLGTDQLFFTVKRLDKLHGLGTAATGYSFPAQISMGGKRVAISINRNSTNSPLEIRFSESGVSDVQWLFRATLNGMED